MCWNHPKNVTCKHHFHQQHTALNATMFIHQTTVHCIYLHLLYYMCKHMMDKSTTHRPLQISKHSNESDSPLGSPRRHGFRCLVLGSTRIIGGIPSGELSHSNGKSPFLMGKSTISMAIYTIAFCMFTRGFNVNVHG